ncbi:hypothetical protein [Chryseobacterium sp. Tr-659]|uniref:hypothetical protein n=1 Tax=Chryseobacterium sp. Tr-659 TaxID=2608340 RepID=UPI00142423E3|nr:hypothetical protein [Chryseobacterium sp. Tr-659]
MKNSRNNKLSREQLKRISGGKGGGIIIGKNCTYECCPTDGRQTCPDFMCPDVVCPEYF